MDRASNGQLEQDKRAGKGTRERTGQDSKGLDIFTGNKQGTYDRRQDRRQGQRISFKDGIRGRMSDWTAYRTVTGQMLPVDR